jgi:resolvase-like protein
MSQREIIVCRSDHMPWPTFCTTFGGMDVTPQDDAGQVLRAAVYARLSETYDAAESVPTQLSNAERHAGRRGWAVVARFKDDGYSAFKEVRRDDFVNLIGAKGEEQRASARAGV